MSSSTPTDPISPGKFGDVIDKICARKLKRVNAKKLKKRKKALDTQHKS